MPFSFQPTTPQEGAQAEQPAPAMSTMGSSAHNLMVRASGAGKSIVEIFLFVVFGVMVLITVGLFGYKFFLSSQIEGKKEKLARYEASLTGYPIEEMRKLSNRLKIVSQLVKEHPSVNVAFLIVEASVENMVTFTKFDLRYSDTAKSYKLVLNGVAPDYKAVAQQLDALQMDPYKRYIPKFTLETLNPDANGRIVFSISMPIAITGLVPDTFSIMDGVARPAAPIQTSSTTPAETGIGSSTPLGNL